ncbi:hypothetical protein PAMA_003770 [Pampus argenteus]
MIRGGWLKERQRGRGGEGGGQRGMVSVTRPVILQQEGERLPAAPVAEQTETFVSEGLGGFVSTNMDVGATCTHPRGPSAGPESPWPPAIRRLTPEVALFDSSHNPLGKKGVSLTARMCQATTAAPFMALNLHPPQPSTSKPPPTGLTK